MVEISEKAIVKIKGDHKVVAALCMAFDKHYKTIETWITKKDVRLTTPTAVEIIKEKTGLEEGDILVEG